MKRTDKKPGNNLYIIDNSQNELFKGKVEKFGSVFITQDGKYFLITGGNYLYFYEILN